MYVDNSREFTRPTSATWNLLMFNSSSHQTSSTSSSLPSLHFPPALSFICSGAWYASLSPTPQLSPFSHEPLVWETKTCRMEVLEWCSQDPRTLTSTQPWNTCRLHYHSLISLWEKRPDDNTWYQDGQSYRRDMGGEGERATKCKSCW